LLEFNLAQDIEEKKVKPVPPHFFSLNQDIVAWSQGEKCGLKYVIDISCYQSALHIITLKQAPRMPAEDGQAWWTGKKLPPPTLC